MPDAGAKPGPGRALRREVTMINQLVYLVIYLIVIGLVVWLLL
jgi:hypothetical protein